MAPSIHPPCTPAASCQGPRCHPTPPPCQFPEECLINTIRKGVAPCKSAVSIMAQRSKCRSCMGCGKFNNRNIDDPGKVKYIEEYLKRKSYENNLKRMDRLTGSHRYLDYQRSQGLPRRERDCCAGHGHRGRLQRSRKKKKNERDKFDQRKKKKCVIL